MEKKYIRALFVLFLMGAVGFGSYLYVNSRSSFNLTPDQITKDIQNKWVVLSPQGQLWGFSPDQKIELKIIDKKSTTDGKIIAVELKAVAKVPPVSTVDESPKEHVSNPKESKPIGTVQKDEPPAVSVELVGIAKLHYDYIGGQWYLAQVEGITLLVRPY